MYLIKLYICGIKFNRNKMENEIDLTQFTEGKTVLFDFLKRTIETKIEYDKHLGNNFVRFSDTATDAIELTEDNIKWFNIRLKPTQPEPTPQPQTSAVNHPPHYNQYPKEAIDIIIDTFGVSDAIIFCKVNAFKYRLRMGLKGDLAEDFAKEQWYLNKAKELREQVAPFTAAIAKEPQPLKSESDQPLINPDYFEHPDGTKLYWKGSDDGTHSYECKDMLAWGTEDNVLRENFPYRIYKSKIIQWNSKHAAFVIACYYDNNKKVYFFDNGTGKCIKTLDNVYLDFELLKPKRNE